jgi:hypothetical protein
MLSAKYKFLSYKIFILLSLGPCCPGWLHPLPHPSLVLAQGRVKKTPPGVSVHHPLWYLLTFLSPNPSSSSAVKTPENTEEDLDDAELADEGDIQMIYYCD